MKPLKNAFGSVRPYTRHVNGCTRKDDSCRCPKWLYENRKGCVPRRYTLNTPSWAEAQRIAADRLRSFDPEIAAARAVTEKHTASLMTVKDAGEKWIERTKREFGENAGSLPQYRSLMKMWERWAVREHIDYVQDITPAQLETWYGSRDWKRLADTTRKQRWGVMRSVFSYLKDKGYIQADPIAGINAIRIDHDQVQGPYVQHQIDAIFAAIVDTVPVNIHVTERDGYALRLHAFITLLLHVGCDVVDGVLFNHTKLEDVVIEGKTVSVYRYHREKTNVQAVVPVGDDVAMILRSVPMLDSNPEHMPFRNADNDVASDVHNWSRRTARVLEAAAVRYVELPKDKYGRPRRKPANAKQFRHTFAVAQLTQGLRPEVVARQLGHVDTTMVRRHYAPWVPELDEAHIREVLGM